MRLRAIRALLGACSRLDRSPFPMAPGDAGGVSERPPLSELLADHHIHPGVITPPDGCDVNAWALADRGWAQALDRRLGARSAATADYGVEL